MVPLDQRREASRRLDGVERSTDAEHDEAVESVRVVSVERDAERHAGRKRSVEVEQPARGLAERIGRVRDGSPGSGPTASVSAIGAPSTAKRRAPAR